MERAARIRLAIVGLGIAGRRHAAAIAECGEAELVAVANRPVSAVEGAIADDVACFEDTEEMLRAATPDGVIVATPTAEHLGPSLAALEAGADVLVEKPIADSLAAGKTIVEEARRLKRHVLVGHHRRHYRLVQHARRIIAEDLGRLVAVAGQWTLRKDDAYFAPSWRRRRSAGPILTNLVHDLDLLRHLCGDIASVTAETSFLQRGGEKEDAAACLLRFENGALGSFILSDRTPSPWSWELATGENAALSHSGQNAYRFMGTQAALDFPNLTLWSHGAATPDWRGAIESERFDHPPEDAFIAQCRHFCRVIRGEAQPLVSAEDGLESLRATLAVLQSADRGVRVELRAGT